jgi:hypothetical protein
MTLQDLTSLVKKPMAGLNIHSNKLLLHNLDDKFEGPYAINYCPIRTHFML